MRPDFDDLPVIDQTIVEELVQDVADGDPSLLFELVDMFAIEGPRRSARISAAASTGDFATLDGEAHALKGSAGNLGARQVAQLAELLCAEGRRGESRAALRLADQLAREIDAAVRELARVAAGYR
jgi:HPt (histidine-containing phosphotransfer) domain-containing protein